MHWLVSVPYTYERESLMCVKSQALLLLTLCLPRSPICKSVKLPRSPICTVIHMPIVHLYCSMKQFPLFLVRTVWLRYWIVVFSIRFIGKKIQRVEKSTSKNGAPIPVRSKIMWQTGDLYVANKELMRISVWLPSLRVSFFFLWIFWQTRQNTICWDSCFCFRKLV